MATTDVSSLSRTDPSLYPGGTNTTLGQALAGAPVIAPTIDPRFQGLQGQQAQQAQLYKQNAPGLANDVYNATADQSANQLAQAINANKAGYNQRGLLYSGLKQGGEADAATAAANNLAATRQNLNQQVLGNQTTLNQAPIATGIGQAGLPSNQYVAGANQSQLAQQQALYNMQQNSQALNSLGLGLGGVAGLGAAYALTPKTTSTVQNGFGAGINSFAGPDYSSSYIQGLS